MTAATRIAEDGGTRERVASVSGRGARPAALTLIELLVVMAILSILVGAAIPVLSPASDDRRIREASRGVNAFLAGAQTRAVETGRPFGVMLRKLSEDTGRNGDNAACLEMRYVEQPPPFAGFDEGARVMFGSDAIAGGAFNPTQVLMRFVSNGTAVGQATDLLPPGLDPDAIAPRTMRPGDVVEVDGRLYLMSDTATNVTPGDLLDDQGFYETDYGNPDNSLFVTPLDSNAENIRYAYDRDGFRLVNPSGQPARFWSEPKPYKIHRQPTVTLNDPYQLPEGTAIDLRASGIGDPTNGGQTFYNDDRFGGATPTAGTANNREPIYVMFAPEGTIERVQFDRGTIAAPIAFNEPITETLYLLIGLRENLPLVIDAREADFDDGAGEAGAGTDAEVQDRKAKINWLNGDARWVAVGARTGSVLTAENTFVNPIAIANQTAPVDLTMFPASLTNRRSLEIRAARELASQRAQLGGR